MRITLPILALLSLLSACVEIPEPPLTENTAPTIELESVSLRAFPGTSFRVDSTLSDAESDPSELTVSWVIVTGDVIVLEQNSDYAVFTIELNASPSQQVEIRATVTDPDGAEGENTVTLAVEAEPSVFIDAQTSSVTLAEQNPIYIVGAYSGKRVNVKADDALASINYIIDQSPNGRYLFYTQLFSGNTWQANLYDTELSVHYVIDMDFANRDINRMQSYWSHDSQYLAIKAPHSSVSTQDRLYWFSISDVQSTEISTTREIVSFDDLIWSDNVVGAGQQAYAALTSADAIKVFNPAETGQRLQTLKDNTLASTQDFQLINSDSAQWASNQLLFTASVTFTSDPEVTPYRTVLYQWQPSNSKTKELTDAGGAQEVAEFLAYSASAIVMNANEQLWFFDGSSAVQITLADIPSLEPENTAMAWSPLGRLLAIVTNPANTSTSGNWKFVTWSKDGHEFLNADWADVGEPNVTDWQWNQTKDSISLLSVDDSNNASKFFDGITNANLSFATKVDTVSHIGAAENGYELRNSLVRSPAGKWQLFWAADLDNASRHLDLWAYNTETSEYENVSRLKDSYLKPISEANFEEVPGFGLADATLAQVGSQLTWLSEDELVFTVGSLAGASDITDIRMINLANDDMAHSLLVRSTELTDISALIQP
jgi:hypothetical protein